jgi:hypothetical protein
MKYYAYVRNLTYAQYCLNREKDNEIDDGSMFLKDYLQTVGTSSIVTELQETHLVYDMFWCYVEIKEGWSVKLLSPL